MTEFRKGKSKEDGVGPAIGLGIPGNKESPRNRLEKRFKMPFGKSHHFACHRASPGPRGPDVCVEMGEDVSFFLFFSSTYGLLGFCNVAGESLGA